MEKGKERGGIKPTHVNAQLEMPRPLPQILDQKKFQRNFQIGPVDVMSDLQMNLLDQRSVGKRFELCLPFAYAPLSSRPHSRKVSNPLTKRQ